MSSPLEFHKMHGAGNDFVLIDARRTGFKLKTKQARRIADRHFGIGCDQLFVLYESSLPECHLRYEIRNSDGTVAAQCGNGARCVALYIHMFDNVTGNRFKIESPPGVIAVERCADGEYELEMGVPDFEADHIPLNMPTRKNMYCIESPWGSLEFGAVSMGNPHSLVVCDDIDDENIPSIGEYLGAHDVFPDGVNAGFAQIENENAIRLRVIERGAGETLACGSGASAAVAILRRLGRVGDAVGVSLPGGHLVIKWRGGKDRLTMKGPAEYVFRGIMNE